MVKIKTATNAETPQKGERGAILTQKQYDLIVAFHRNGVVPSQIELEDAEIGDPNQSAYNKTGRFKSWARRMYLRLSDDTLIHKITGKKILPQEKFESVILAAHRGSQAGGSNSYNHHSTSATIRKMMKKYTFGKRSFGMSEETVRDVLMSCTTGSCALKKNPTKRNRARKKIVKDIQHVSAKARAMIVELQKSLPVVKPRMIVPKEAVTAPKTTATITRAVPLITTSDSCLKPTYPMVYTNNIFNRCRPSITATGVNPATTAFLPHPGVPPNFIGVPQLLPGLGSKMYLVPHTPGSNFMSLLQATAPQTQQLNPGANLPGHVISTTVLQPSVGQGYSVPDQALHTKSTKKGNVGKMSASKSKTDDRGSKLLKSLANKSKKKFDALKNTKTPELAKMLALPTLVKPATSEDNIANQSSTLHLPKPPVLQGPLNMMKSVVENVGSVVRNSSTLHTATQETADKKTITICVFPFPANSVSSNITSQASATVGFPVSITSLSSGSAKSAKSNITGKSFTGQVSYSSLANVDTTQSITAPVSSLKTDCKENTANISPRKVLSESSANTKKKLKAKLSSQRLSKGPKSPVIKDNFKIVSANTSENGDATLLIQNPDSQKSIKLDRARLLHLLKKEKSSKIKALLLRTLRRLKKTTINPLRSCLNMTNKEENIPEENFECKKEFDSGQELSAHASLFSELIPEDECSQQAEWNLKCISVLGEAINMYEPPLCSTFPNPLEKMEQCRVEIPFPDSGPLPQPHIWHHYEDILSQRHCFKRLLPVFKDMKLDIMRSAMKDQSAVERLKKKITYGESLINRFREYLGGFED
ncbi:uncharacterized protein LOC110453637 [Mizuhopecten yessoensis]|uniref:Uncharacterized protein n=1 Tax=Mizuhopecten yessoensis TaxID=6573 RepID=A0A210QGX6_MIZYE|nr:uncharacterized protein LOC110453637 [Mizuhopecten yessoensis]OWF48005.1 hypothetical protein KP79_PYT13916 [Mizuhopecten yessoensis]